MQMRPSGPAGHADRSDPLATFNRLPFSNVDGVQVTIHGDEPLAVIYEHRLAIEEKIPDSDDAS